MVKIGVRSEIFLFLGYPVSKVVVKGAGKLPPIFKRYMEIFLKILEDRKIYCQTEGTVFDYEFD